MYKTQKAIFSFGSFNHLINFINEPEIANIKFFIIKLNWKKFRRLKNIKLSNISIGTVKRIKFFFYSLFNKK